MNNSGTKTGLFLMELVIALLLFAFCAAICMQLFTAARGRTRDSDNLSQAVYLSTSAAECYKVSGGDLQAVQALLGGEIWEGALLIFYDTNWEQAASLDAFFLKIRETGFGVAEIAVFKTARNENGEFRDSTNDAKLVYSITVKAVSGVA